MSFDTRLSVPAPKPELSSPQADSCFDLLLGVSGQLKDYLQTARAGAANARAFKRLQADLAATAQHANACLASSHPGAPLKTVAQVASVIQNWDQHPKRARVLALFADHRVDPRITAAIDETLSEDSGNLLSLMNLDVKNELLNMLAGQVKFVQQAVLEHYQAATPAARRAALARLQPAGTETDKDLMFDVFDNSLMTVDDLELSVAAIVVFGILKA